MSKFHFIKNKAVTLAIIAVVLVVGLASFFIRGFNIDIDFSGGTEITIDLGTEATAEVCDNVNKIIEEHIGQKYVSSTTQSATKATTVIIRTGTEPLNTEQQTILKRELVKAYPDTNVNNTDIAVISPTIGASLTKKAILAVSIAVVLMLIYIWIRFELNSGIAAVLCLTHDLFVMFAIYSLFQIPIDQNIIAALLTILGYSINATIIVFDRVRENKLKNSDACFSDVVNKSVHETLGRSINTTITTLLTIGMIYILGGDSIRDFALPLIVGIVAGLFSSVFMSGMIWNALNKVIKTKKESK